MRNKSYRVCGIILKRVNIGEADKILTVFTRERGKIVCLAKGIRKICSRRAPALEPFNKISAQMVKGKNIDLVAEVEVIKSFPDVKKNLFQVGWAYYIAELVDKLTAQEQENLPIYQLFESTLVKIQNEGVVNQELIIGFQKNLLLNLGFGLPDSITKDSLRWYIETIVSRKLASQLFINKIE